MIGFEDTERKISTLVEECILNCSIIYILFRNQNDHRICSDNGPDDIRE